MKQHGKILNASDSSYMIDPHEDLTGQPWKHPATVGELNIHFGFSFSHRETIGQGDHSVWYCAWGKYSAIQMKPLLLPF